MNKSSFRTGRTLLRAVLGMLLAGVLGAMLLVFLYMSMAKTPSHALAPLAQDQPRRASSDTDTPQPLPKPQQGTEPETLVPAGVSVAGMQPLPVPHLVNAIPNAPAPPGKRWMPIKETQNVWVTDSRGGMRQKQVLVTRYVLAPSGSVGTHGDEQLGEWIPLSSNDRRAEELAAKIRESDDESEQASLREQLLAALNTAFDERRERQSESINELEKQLEELRALHQQRGERKAEIVQRRMSELLAEPDVLAWDPDYAAANTSQLAPATSSPGDLTVPRPPPSLAAPAASDRTTPPIDGPAPGRLMPPPIAPAPASAASEDPFGSQSSPAEATFGFQPSRSTPPTEDPFGGPSQRSPAPSTEDPFGGSPKPAAEDPFGGPGPFGAPNANAGPAEPTAERAAATAERRPSSAAEFDFEARGGTIRFDDAERIMEMISEIADTEAELATGAVPEGYTKRRLQLARGKLGIAEVAWQQTEQLLRSRVDTAKSELEAAEQRLREHESQPDNPFKTSGRTAQAQIKQAIAKLRAAQSQLQAWQQADEILQKHRAAIEQPDAEQPVTAPPDAEQPGDAVEPRSNENAEPIVEDADAQDSATTEEPEAE